MGKENKKKDKNLSNNQTHGNRNTEKIEKLNNIELSAQVKPMSVGKSGISVNGNTVDAKELVHNGSNTSATPATTAIPATPVLNITPAENSYKSPIGRDSQAQYQDFINRQADIYRAQQALQLKNLGNKTLPTEKQAVPANNQTATTAKPAATVQNATPANKQPAMPDLPFKFSYNPSNASKTQAESKPQAESKRIISEDGTNPLVMNAISGTPVNENAPQTALEKAEKSLNDVHYADRIKQAEAIKKAAADKASAEKAAAEEKAAEKREAYEKRIAEKTDGVTLTDDDVLSQANLHLPKEFHERLDNELTDFLKNNKIPMLVPDRISFKNIDWDKLSAKQSKLLRSKLDEQEALKIKIYERNRDAGFYDENNKTNPDIENQLTGLGVQSTLAEHEKDANDNFIKDNSRVQQVAEDKKDGIEEEEMNTLEAMLAKLKKDAEKDKTDAQKMQQYYALADVLKKLGQMGGGLVGGAIGGNVLDSMPNIGEYKESRGYLDAFESAKKANDKLRSFDDKEFSLALREDDRRYQKQQAEIEREFRLKEKQLDRDWQMTFYDYQNQIQQANAEKNFERQAALQKELAEKKHEYDVALTNLRGEWEVKQRNISRSRYRRGAKTSDKATEIIDFEDGSQLAVTKEEYKAIYNRYIGSTFKNDNNKTEKVTSDNIKVFMRKNPSILNGFIENRRKKASTAETPAGKKAETPATPETPETPETKTGGTGTNIFAEYNKKPGISNINFDVNFDTSYTPNINLDKGKFAPEGGNDVDYESFARK